jgi:WD40 repeat protein
MKRPALVLIALVLAWPVATARPPKEDREDRGFGGGWGGHVPLAFSPDGKSALALGGGRLFRWDLAAGTKEEVALPRLLYDSEKDRRYSPLGALAFSPDGRWAVSGRRDGALLFWEVADPEGARRVKGGHDRSDVLAAAVSPDGKRAVTGAEDGSVKLWDLAAGGELRELRTAGEPIWRVAFSPSGRLIACGDRGGEIRLWTAEGRPLRRLVGPEKEIDSLAFLPSERFLLTAARDGRVRLWEVASGKEALLLEKQARPSYFGLIGVGCTPDGKQATALDREGNLTYWDVGTGKIVRTVEGFGKWPLYSPDGKRALTGGWNLTLWETGSWEEVRTLAGERLEGMAIWRVSLSPDGKRLLSACGDTLTLWRLPSLEVARVFEPVSDEPLHDVAVDWKSGAVITGHRKGMVRVWDLDTGKRLLEFRACQESVSGLAVSPDGKYIYTSGRDLNDQGSPEKAVPKVWDRDSGKEVRRLTRLEEAGYYGAVFLLDGRRALLPFTPSELWLWDLEDDKAVWTIKAEQTGNVGIMAVSPDGKQLLTGGHELVLRDVGSGRVLKVILENDDDQIKILKRCPTAIAFLPKALRDQVTRLTEDLQHCPSAITFLPDGKRALTGGVDGDLKVWNLARGRVERELIGPGAPATVEAVAVSADGKLAVTAGEGQTLKLWDLEQGRLIRALKPARAPAKRESSQVEGRPRPPDEGK